MDMSGQLHILVASNPVNEPPVPVRLGAGKKGI
jgi:hypothetical protein